MLNGDAKTVARLVWWDGALQAPGQAALPVRVDIECLRGYQKDAGEVERLLRAGAPLASTSGSWLDDVRGMAGLVPIGTRRFEMRPDQPADLVVAEALLGYLSDLEANVAGVIGDIDTEYLHDLRIAVRRTRSIVKLLGDILPDGLAERMAPEFRWLGQVTTPARDLDVYLLSVDELAASVTRPADLDPFAEHIRGQRSLAYRSLVRALRSRRFATLCRGLANRTGVSRSGTGLAPAHRVAARGRAGAAHLPQGAKAGATHRRRLTRCAGARTSEDVQGNAVPRRAVQAALRS